MAEEELMVVLRKSEDATFGFSLLRTEVFPHVIYDIVENSPAAECGEVSHRPRNTLDTKKKKMRYSRRR